MAPAQTSYRFQAGGSKTEIATECAIPFLAPFAHQPAFNRFNKFLCALLVFWTPLLGFTCFARARAQISFGSIKNLVIVPTGNVAEPHPWL